MLAATRRQSPPQIQQAEAIVERSFEHIDAARTLAGLGLRVQGLTLAQDANNVSLQQDAIHVEVHDALYDEEDEPAVGMQSPCPSTSTVQSGQLNLSQFFQTLLLQSPFTATPPVQTPTINRWVQGNKLEADD